MWAGTRSVSVITAPTVLRTCLIFSRYSINTYGINAYQLLSSALPSFLKLPASPCHGLTPLHLAPSLLHSTHPYSGISSLSSVLRVSGLSAASDTDDQHLHHTVPALTFIEIEVLWKQVIFQNSLLRPILSFHSPSGISKIHKASATCTSITITFLDHFLSWTMELFPYAWNPFPTGQCLGTRHSEVSISPLHGGLWKQLLLLTCVTHSSILPVARLKTLKLFVMMNTWQISCQVLRIFPLRCLTFLSSPFLSSLSSFRPN